MASKAIKSKLDNPQNVNQTCRLCMGEKSLQNIVNHKKLHQWISDFLSIKISSQDGMSQAVCAICRKMLFKFYEFSIRCKVVQGVLQAKLRSETTRKAKETECQICHKIYKTEKHLIDHMRYHGPKNHVCTTCGKAFTRRHQLDKHVKTHSKQKVEVQPIPQLEERTITVQEGLKSKAEHCEADDLTMGTQKQLEDTESVANGTGQLSESYSDIMLKKDDIKIEIIPIDSSLLNDREDILDENAQEVGDEDGQFVIEDIIVIEQVKIEPHPDDNVVTFPDETFTKMYENNEDETINQNENSPQYDSRMAESANFNKNITVETDATNDNGGNGNAYACSKCDRSFKRQCQLKNHMANHEKAEDSNDAYDEAEEEALNEDDAESYQAENEDTEEHDSNDDKTTTEGTHPLTTNNSAVKDGFECNICHKVVSDKRKLKDHKRSHKPKDHVCSICEKPFVRRPVMLRHMLTHVSRPKYQRKKPVIEEGPFQCDMCQKEFKSKNKLHCHNMKVHGPKKHECNICGSRFIERFTLKMHLKSHARSRDREEDFKQFKQMLQMNTSSNPDNGEKGTGAGSTTSSQTIQNSGELALECVKCHKAFKTQRDLLRHYKYNHVPKNRLYCTMCSLVFVTRKRLELHMLKHQQENDSSQSKMAENLSEIDANKVVKQTIESVQQTRSTDQQIQDNKDIAKAIPFQCNICQKQYETRLKLYLHHRAVHGPKNHNCLICAIRFATRLELKKHLCTKQHMRKLQEALGHKSAAGSTNDSEKDPKGDIMETNDPLLLTKEVASSIQQEVQCDVCLKFYPNKWRLRNHKRYHGPRIHKCTICDRGFAMRDFMLRHMQTHKSDNKRKRLKPLLEGETIKCDFCPKEFKNFATLWSHKKRTHGPKNHECHICGFRYSQNYILKKHLEMHTRHGDSAEDYRLLKQMQDKRKSTVPVPQIRMNNEGPLECSKCHKKFKNQKLLGLHYKFRHISKNIRKCHLCNKFVTIVRFEKHMRTKHKNEDGTTRSPECDICDAVFPTYDQLEKHMEIHDPKKYDCKICDKSFKASRLLVKHLKFHENNTGDKEENNQD